MDGNERQSMLDQIARRDDVIALQTAEIIVLKQKTPDSGEGGGRF
jgi:hypothetical protein